MRISAVAFFMILTTVFLSGCGRQEMVSLDEHGGSFYGRGGVVNLAGASAAAVTKQAVPTAGTVAKHSVKKEATSVTAAAPKSADSWQWPVHGNVTQTFGDKGNGVVNEGIVIAAAADTPIHAARAGEVAFVGEDTRNYGNIVILRHADGALTAYSHAKAIAVEKGDRVSRGEVVGYVGNSGDAKEPQLHFAVREGDSSVDPLSKLPHQVASN